MRDRVLMPPRSPHIARERYLVRGVLFSCIASGLAIGAAAGDLLGACLLWGWLGLAMLLGAAAARGLRAGG